MKDKSETQENELSDLGRKLAAARRTVAGVCPVCGNSFTGVANKKFDKHSCAVIASRRKRRAEQVSSINR